MKTKKITKILLMFCILSVFLSGCAGDSMKEKNEETENTDNNKDFTVAFSRKVARKVCDDGWVFTFVQNIDKCGDDSNLKKYQFYGINIRYRFDEKYDQILTHTYDNGTVVKECYTPPVMIWGNGSENQKNDMAKIDEILDNTNSVDKLLSLNPDNYNFKELDKEIFFELMKEAINGEPQKEGTDLSYWDKPVYAFYVEPTYIDGYKFQIAFLNETGCVDELFIDILYKTGEEYNDYVQLSDMIDSGEATDEQKELFKLISTVVEQIKDEENFLAGREKYQEKEMAGVDLSRMYTFLKNIHENNFSIYNEEPITHIIDEAK